MDQQQPPAKVAVSGIASPPRGVAAATAVLEVQELAVNGQAERQARSRRPSLAREVLDAIRLTVAM